MIKAIYCLVKRKLLRLALDAFGNTDGKLARPVFERAFRGKEQLARHLFEGVQWRRRTPRSS